ncbi:lactonase family protein [Ancylomarina longa]|nr:lactonase family protein [Ancylomarina longa]
MKKVNYSFYVGTYTDTSSKGIYKVEMDSIGHMTMLSLQARSDNPSFLTFANNGNTLLAVNEINTVEGKGTVESYLVGNSLKLISRRSSGGAHPCFVGANQEGIVLTANYTSGTNGLLKVDKDSKLSTLLDVQQHIGSGANKVRQDKAHAHSIWFVPNSNLVIAVDLGTNELWISEIDRVNNKFRLKDKLEMEDGAGPRHLAFHPNDKYIYVINELNNTISTVQIAADKTLSLLGSVSTLPNDFQGESFPADIHISSDGNFLYASNRGHNSIAIYKVSNGGKLNSIGFESTLGDHPRNFSLSPDEKFLLVANQNTNNIVCFKRDKKTGLLTFVEELKVAKPVCILFQK